MIAANIVPKCFEFALQRLRDIRVSVCRVNGRCDRIANHSECRSVAVAITPLPVCHDFIDSEGGARARRSAHHTLLPRVTV